MLNRELIDLINSGETVAFVGSGPSIEAGIVSWGGLFDGVCKLVEENGGKTASALAIAPKDLPRAFDELRIATSQTFIQSAVRKVIGTGHTPANQHKTIASWPFRYYITTNYDHLLETATENAFLSIGNTANETTKLSGSIERVVWHPHGSAEQDETKTTRLVVSSSDYDELYPDSRIAKTIETLGKTRQFVYFGFGFNDPDLSRILDIIARTSNPLRPAYAFLGEREPDQRRRDEFRSRYNIEVIPYAITDKNNHSHLGRVLSAYGSFIIPRSTTFSSRGVPEYHEQTTSLQVHNRLGGATAPDASVALTRAWALSALRHKSPQSIDDLFKQAPASIATQKKIECLMSLKGGGLISVVDDFASLEPRGRTLTTEAAAKQELVRDQFAQSIGARAKAIGSASADASLHLDATQRQIAKVAISFLEGLAKKKGLGVAQNLVSMGKSDVAHRAVALMQTLPEHFDSLGSRSQAFALIDIVSGVLKSPTKQESVHLGFLTQAYFGQILLGASDSIRELDRSRLGESCYLLDSDLLIALLCLESEPNAFAQDLIKTLRDLGAKLYTTDLLRSETHEHIDWARRLVARVGEDSSDLIDAARGVRGYRPNLLIDGYVRFSSTKKRGATFAEYLNTALPGSSVASLEYRVIDSALSANGISVQEFSKWENFTPLLFKARDVTEAEIKTRRLTAGSYKHDRQVRAEAEVAQLVTELRAGRLTIKGKSPADALFVSQSRVVENLDGLAKRITVLPDGLAQLLWTSEPFGDERAALLFEALLGELGQAGMTFVSEEHLLGRFSGVVDAARSTLEQAASTHRELLFQQIGADPSTAFAKVSALDAPFMAKSIGARVVAVLGKQLQRSESERMEAQRQAKIADRERKELAELRAEKAKRQRKDKKRRASRR